MSLYPLASNIQCTVELSMKVNGKYWICLKQYIVDVRKMSMLCLEYIILKAIKET